MYRTCIYCHRDLGANESVENFPTGRRLAFDQARGRLWVICTRCRRWNLTPLEERWEAIEECERYFRDALTRFSTENIGLAQLEEGTQLVRIGRPIRPEFAAWRYGREFWRRNVRAALSVSTQAALVAGSFLGSAVNPAVIPVVGVLSALLGIKRLRIAAFVRDEQGKSLYISKTDVGKVELQRDDAAGGWVLVVPYFPREGLHFYVSQALRESERAVIAGRAAIRAAGHVLAAINDWGGTQCEVRRAVEYIEESRSPGQLFQDVATDLAVRVAAARLARPRPLLAHAEPIARLALEMVAHEEAERRAMEGDLAKLEEAWREAEEVAAIADLLLVPPKVEEWIRRHRKVRTSKE